MVLANALAPCGRMAVAQKFADRLARLALSAGHVGGMMALTLDKTGS